MSALQLHYKYFLMLMFTPYLLGEATNGWMEDRTYLFTLSSCLLYNTSQLHYYCADNEQEMAAAPIAVNEHDLNTLKVQENLCGRYSNNQMQGVAYNITVFSYIICTVILHNFKKAFYTT